MENTNLKPSVRFPEFTKNWRGTKFKNHFEFKNTNSLSRENLNYESGEVKNIHYGDIHTKFDTHFDIKKEELPFINDDVDISRIDDENYVLNGDLVMADASEDYADIGKTIEITNTNNEKILAGLHTFLARKTDETLAKGFFGHLLTTYKARIELMTIAQGTKVLGLSKGRVEKIDLFIPKPAEQQKIANFLTKVDSHITLLKEKKEALVEYKKGVLQKIFNQDIRFKDDNGNDFPDWEEKKLGTIGKFQTSSVDKLTIEGEKKIFLVNYMNVYNHEEINNQTVKVYQVVSAKDSQIESSNLKKGDILFTPSSETASDIGHSVVIFEDIENAVYSYHLMRFRPNVDLDLKYSHYFCNNSSVLKQMTRFSTGSTRYTISVGNFSKVNVSIPTKLEQTKIANYLTVLDDKIDALEQKIDASVDFKKGLLQKMFV
ncbi:restriction endonuclease subunit S [Flavicella sp.]|uniref:restriction endonuclease subunit S n=1 Tax=Flavicella sp. TaxID=2957742 RepID=UPI003018F33C